MLSVWSGCGGNGAAGKIHSTLRCIKTGSFSFAFCVLPEEEEKEEEEEEEKQSNTPTPSA